MPRAAGPRWPLRVGVIGAGAIGGDVIAAITAASHGLRADRCRLVAVLVRRPREAEEAYTVTHEPEAFFAHAFDVVVAAAGQGAMRDHGVRILESGAEGSLPCGMQRREGCNGLWRHTSDARSQRMVRLHRGCPLV